jgi:DNA-binding response OmpR family regulator
LIDSRHTILVAEEDDATRAFVADQLMADGYEVVAASTRQHALVLLCQLMPDLVLVDVNGQTLELVDAVRGGRGVAGRVNPDVPIVVLSGQLDELARVRCLERGADDVVDKPFSYPELRGRIAAILRRAYRDQRRTVVRAGPLTLDLTTRTAEVAGEALELSRLEFALLRTLAADPERVFTREELMRDVWGYRCPGRTRTLDSHASRLRRKLRAAGGAGLLVNVWGVGYRLTDLGRVAEVA